MKAMTESEWLVCITPAPMLDYLIANDLITDRKQRLFDCACVRRIWHLLLDERGRRAVEIAEKYADGLAVLHELREAQGVALAAADAQATLHLPGIPNSYSVLAAAAEAAWEFRNGVDPLRHAAEAHAWEGLAQFRPPERRLAKAKLADEQIVQAALLRDIVGNPFRNPFHPLTFDPSWRSLDADRLASFMYSNRAFNRMPALGESLEIAGCRDQEILRHCREPGEHVRGCWVVDLVMREE
jgi:hypothetical protein